ncbi:hypothetical protein EYF80_035901 [Liparis tanakae]|uniref:Uncharacterized protein n=1 Tax=Liparis tanakae TaxID=230148 RepID=A0A4Z2GM98_9TELE|nr:hypothetical protein EYF80_035901 [Liparis tanakae]
MTLTFDPIDPKIESNGPRIITNHPTKFHVCDPNPEKGESCVGQPDPLMGTPAWDQEGSTSSATESPFTLIIHQK